MDSVPIRALRNHGGEVAERVQAGEHLVVTHAGKPVMELVPVSRPPLRAAALVDRWKNLPAIDPQRLRRDLGAVLDDRP